MTLSDKKEILLDFNAMIQSKHFKKEMEGFGVFYPKKEVKESIEGLKEKINKSFICKMDKSRAKKIIDEAFGEDLI